MTWREWRGPASAVEDLSFDEQDPIPVAIEASRGLPAAALRAVPPDAVIDLPLAWGF